jgi:hypothetical protein
MQTAVLDAARAIQRERYPDAEVMFAAGSLVRGEGSAFSDLDLVVVCSTLPTAYRESFRFDGYPVEAFVHDPQTLEYFFVTIDRVSGFPVLPQMVVEGIEIPQPTKFSASLKARAAAIIQAGPPPLDVETDRRRRYVIADLLDDLRGVGSRNELVATGTRLYEELADYHLRRNGYWSGRGKALLRALQRADPKLCTEFCETFDQLFQHDNTEIVIRLAETLLRQHGGLLFDGYRSDAPSDWR